MLKCSHVKNFSATDDIEMNCKITFQRHFFFKVRRGKVYISIGISSSISRATAHNRAGVLGKAAVSEAEWCHNTDSSGSSQFLEQCRTGRPRRCKVLSCLNLEQDVHLYNSNSLQMLV